MAKITIPVDLLQEYLDEEAVVNITRFRFETNSLTFEWEQTSDHEESDGDVSWSVDTDLVFVTDDYVDADVHEKLVQQHDHEYAILNLERDRLSGELKRNEEYVRQLIKEKADLQLALAAATAQKKPFWKVW